MSLSIYIRNRYSIEQVSHNKAFALISIQDSKLFQDSLFPKLSISSPHCKGAVLLRFDDIKTESDTHERISLEQAKCIANFVESVISQDIEELYINCVAGISRSAGIGAAISKFYTGDDEVFFKKYIPNSAVYTMVLEQLMYLDKYIGVAYTT